MYHVMKLQSHYFEQIAQKTKTIEVRLNDEKRRALNIGDIIVFCHTTTNQLLTTTITQLAVHETFTQLFASAPAIQFGVDEHGDLPNMHQFYNIDDEKKYGVVGIHLSSVTPITTQELTLAAYNQDLAGYLAKLPPDEVVQKTIDSIIPHLTKAHPILEIGSGTGRDADYLESKGFTVIRTDIAQAFIDYQKYHNKEIQYYNVLTQPFSPKQNAILINGVLVHFTGDEVATMLKNCHDSLQENGLLFINTKEGDSEELTTNMSIPRFMKKWNPEELSRLITENGLTIIETKLSDDGAWRLYIVKK